MSSSEKQVFKLDKFSWNEATIKGKFCKRLFIWAPNEGRAMNKLIQKPKKTINVIKKDILFERLNEINVTIKPFRRNAITKLIITGSNTFPNKRIKINEHTNKIAK